MKELDAITFPLSGHKVIEASAGTGKTYTITNLYLRLLLGHNKKSPQPLRVNEILVLTFTNAATNELRHRIRQRILLARACFKNPDTEFDDPFLMSLREHSVNLTIDAKILTAAIQLMDEAAIYTIHGFCARVLNEQPFETGTLFDQPSDADSNQLLRLASEDFFRTFIQTLHGAEIEIAIELWPNPETLANSLKPLLGKTDITLVPDCIEIQDQLHLLEQEIDQIKATWIDADIQALLESCGINRTRKTYTRLGAMTEFCHGNTYLTDLWEHFTVDTITRNLTKAGTLPAHDIFQNISNITDSEHLFQQLKINLWHQSTQWIEQRIHQFKENLGSFTPDDLLAQVDTAITQSDAQTGLAQILAKRWPVAMIDEFQDTDSAQYRIFKNIYNNPATSSLFMIGDPKQAIYQFRGADIYTYINAKRQVDAKLDLFSLGTNWRSSPRLVRAINYLFDKPDIFSNDRDIPFVPVTWPASRADEKLSLNGQTVTPIEIFTLSKTGKSINKNDVLRLAMDYTAQEISRLRGSDPGTGASGKSNLDIAILVRDRFEMRAAKSALETVGIRSVFVTQDSVLDSSVAEDLYLVLTAVAEPNNAGAIRSAIATKLCQSSANEIDRINHNLSAYQDCLAEFHRYHITWSKFGIALMIGQFIEHRKLAQKWLCQMEGDRTLTNLRHLAELLQNQSNLIPGIQSLVQWFGDEQQNKDAAQQEDRQLRLDSDSDLVKLVTMHASKGLEYDIVFIPVATISAREIAKDMPALSHADADGSGSFRTTADVGNNPHKRLLSQAETQAENMRLLYVAITRAKSRCYIGISPVKGAGQSSIATLLGLSSTLETETPYTPLESLPADLFTIVDIDKLLPASDKIHTGKPETHQSRNGNLLEPPAIPVITDPWRTHSYTGISRMLTSRNFISDEQNQATLPGYLDDDKPAKVILLDTSQDLEVFDQYHFPKGPRIGVALHDLLEKMDFTGPETNRRSSISRFIQRVGTTANSDAWTDAVEIWTSNILATPISTTGDSTGSFTLNQITSAARLNELEFFFPLDSKRDPIGLLKKNGYLEQGLSLTRVQLAGVMNGFVDLILEYEDKYYIIDYKSNFLGLDQSFYSIDNIATHMSSHHYHLQYLIYCVAVNRYLQTRIANYDYDQHFGGVHYLFLRGMQKDIPDSGIFSHRPEKQLILDLDRNLLNRGQIDV